MAACAVAAVVASAIGVGSALAASKATAPVELHNGNCGHTTGAPVIGQATFSRNGNTLTVTYTLTNGMPFTDYEVFLYDGANCAQLYDAGDFSTDASGAGSKTFTINVAGHQSFFADGDDGSFANDSLIANVPATGLKLAAPIPQVNHLFLCYSKFQTDPGVWDSDTAALLLIQGYWIPYGLAGNVDGATNVGDYHLVCNLTGTQTPSGTFVDDEGTVWSSDYAAMPGLYPIAG